MSFEQMCANCWCYESDHDRGRECLCGRCETFEVVPPNVPSVSDLGLYG